MSRVATQTNNYMRFVQKFHKGINCVHVLVHIIIDYVSNYMDTRVSEEKHERSQWEKSERESGLGFTSQNIIDYLQKMCRLNKL